MTITELSVDEIRAVIVDMRLHALENRTHARREANNTARQALLASAIAYEYFLARIEVAMRDVRHTV